MQPTVKFSPDGIRAVLVKLQHAISPWLNLHHLIFIQQVHHQLSEEVKMLDWEAVAPCVKQALHCWIYRNRKHSVFCSTYRAMPQRGRSAVPHFGVSILLANICTLQSFLLPMWRIPGAAPHASPISDSIQHHTWRKFQLNPVSAGFF